MVDIITLAVALLVALIVLVKKTSAGVGLLSLLAGVLLDQLLATWVLRQLPVVEGGLSTYVPVVVRLLLTFTPVVVSLVSVKVHRHNAVMSLITSLVLGFMLVYFGLKILAPLPGVSSAAANAGILVFLAPYQNAILSAGAVLAIAEMVISHKKQPLDDKKKK